MNEKIECPNPSNKQSTKPNLFVPKPALGHVVKSLLSLVYVVPYSRDWLFLLELAHRQVRVAARYSTINLITNTDDSFCIKCKVILHIVTLLTSIMTIWDYRHLVTYFFVEVTSSSIKRQTLRKNICKNIQHYHNIKLEYTFIQLIHAPLTIHFQ
jgi:hypothetical protein